MNFTLIKTRGVQLLTRYKNMEIICKGINLRSAIESNSEQNVSWEFLVKVNIKLH